ncbi:MAG: hypothetical protein AB7T37_01555 [Dehalococcoidia bacterium]
MAEIRLGDDGNRALGEAQNFCRRANVAIVGAEHLLAGALVVLSESGAAGMPERTALESALMLAQGAGSDAISEQVMFGSSAREAINSTAGTVRQGGGTIIGARELALGTIGSGNVSPMFFAALGVDRETLRAALSAENEML